MPLPVISDVIRTSWEGTLSNGHKFANVVHYRKSGALTFAGAIALLDPIIVDHLSTNNGTGTGWNGHAPASAQFTQIRYTPLDGSSATTVIGHIIPGVAASEPLPASVAAVVTLRTALRGRSFRGRVYQAPFTEAANTATGTILASSVTGVLQQWVAHLSALVGTGLSLVVASYHLALATDVASVSVDTRWDTQRRRLNT